jgi:hypothetical protein
MSGIGNFFSSGIGAELLKTGISFGVGYGLHELTSGSGSRPPAAQQPSLTGGTTVNPAGSVFIPQAQPQTPIVIQSASTTPEWVVPVAVIAGLGALFFAMRK